MKAIVVAKGPHEAVVLVTSAAHIHDIRGISTRCRQVLNALMAETSWAIELHTFRYKGFDTRVAIEQMAPRPCILCTPDITRNQLLQGHASVLKWLERCGQSSTWFLPSCRQFVFDPPKRIKCSDLDDREVLSWIKSEEAKSDKAGASLFDAAQHHFKSLGLQRPPFRLIRAKMQTLSRRRFISGCTCGCRGGFQLTPLGANYLSKG